MMKWQNLFKRAKWVSISEMFATKWLSKVSEQRRAEYTIYSKKIKRRR